MWVHNCSVTWANSGMRVRIGYGPLADGTRRQVGRDHWTVVKVVGNCGNHRKLLCWIGTIILRTFNFFFPSNY